VQRAFQSAIFNFAVSQMALLLADLDYLDFWPF
jgi:hypothetical protein